MGIQPSIIYIVGIEWNMSDRISLWNIDGRLPA